MSAPAWPSFGRVLRDLYLVLLAAFILAPLVVVAGVSFNGTRRMAFPPEVWGLRWYRDFFTDPAWLRAAAASAGVAALAALLAASVAFPIAYAVWRWDSRLARALAGLGAAAFMLPPVVIAVVFLVFWGWVGHVGRLENVVVGHAVIFLALPLASLSMGFRLIDRSLVEAARTMGAGEWAIARTIAWPLQVPYLVCGLAFAFVLSLDEYIIAYMVAGFAVETLPVKVFNALRLGFEPTMCVGAVLFMALGAAVFSLVAAFGDLPRLLGAGGGARG